MLPEGTCWPDQATSTDRKKGLMIQSGLHFRAERGSLNRPCQSCSLRVHLTPIHRRLLDHHTHWLLNSHFNQSSCHFNFCALNPHCHLLWLSMALLLAPQVLGSVSARASSDRPSKSRLRVRIPGHIWSFLIFCRPAIYSSKRTTSSRHYKDMCPRRIRSMLCLRILLLHYLRVSVLFAPGLSWLRKRLTTCGVTDLHIGSGSDRIVCLWPWCIRHSIGFQRRLLPVCAERFA